MIGRYCVGDQIGAFPAAGFIRNLAVTGLAASTINWKHQEETFAAKYNYAVAINGNTESLLPPSSNNFSTLLTDGEYRLLVAPIRPYCTKLPRLYGDPYGRTAYIDWLASEDEDVVAYNIYIGGTLVDTVSEVVASGDSRISGTWSGSVENKEYTVEILTSTTFEVDGETYTFTPLVPTPIFNGLSVTLKQEDLVGAEFLFRVGPRTDWTSGELERGSYTFVVRAVDAAGNIGDTASKTLSINPRPDPVTDAAVNWNGTNIVINYAAPSGVAVNLYANYSKDYNRLREYIIEDYPYASPSGSPYSFAPPQNGEWLFYLRTEASGVENLSVQSLRVNTTGIPTTVDIVEPEILAATPGPSGSANLSWLYNWDEGPDATSFRIYGATSASGLFDNVLSTVSGVGTGISEYTVNLPQNFASLGSPYFFGIRAAASGVVSVNNIWVSITPDDQAPVFNGSLEGVPN